MPAMALDYGFDGCCMNCEKPLCIERKNHYALWPACAEDLVQRGLPPDYYIPG
jgi:hypothetical protein